MIRIYRIIICLLLLGALSPRCFSAESQSALLTEKIRNRIEAAGFPCQISIGDEVIYAATALPQFYERRFYRPAWFDDDGVIPQAESLMVALDRAADEGLRPDDYHRDKIEILFQGMEKVKGILLRLQAGNMVDLDLLLTDAFLVLGSHYLSGRVDPNSIDAEWYANLREADLIGILERGLAENGIGRELDSLLPPQPGYLRLRTALSNYRKLAANGGWPIISEGPKLQLGDQGDRVRALRRRLEASDDMADTDSDTAAIFDSALEAGLRRFQARHGLDVDGIAGPATLAALNVGIEDRINQIILNMERWRWLPQDLGKRHILINIASFELDLVQDGVSELEMRVIVGKAYRRTPVFSDRMTYLVLNPYWNIPDNIAVQDILPQVRKDIEYLNRLEIKVLRGWGSEMQVIDPATVDWGTIQKGYFPYRFRQEPGPKNFLGHMKFMFPNKFNVYLHDTPEKNLFSKSVRIFSSGCIRIENAMGLAHRLLQNDRTWTPDKIASALESNIEQTVRLPEAIPVHLLYWTSWVAPDGSIHFREDIYARDERLLSAFMEKPPETPR